MYKYKRDSDDEIVLDSSGPEFFDDSSPWEGVYIKYVKDIVEVRDTKLNWYAIAPTSHELTLLIISWTTVYENKDF